MGKKTYQMKESENQKEKKHKKTSGSKKSKKDKIRQEKNGPKESSSENIYENLSIARKDCSLGEHQSSEYENLEDLRQIFDGHLQGEYENLNSVRSKQTTNDHGGVTSFKETKIDNKRVIFETPVHVWSLKKREWKFVTTEQVIIVEENNEDVYVQIVSKNEEIVMRERIDDMLQYHILSDVFHSFVTKRIEIGVMFEETSSALQLWQTIAEQLCKRSKEEKSKRQSCILMCIGVRKKKKESRRKVFSASPDVNLEEMVKKFNRVNLKYEHTQEKLWRGKQANDQEEGVSPSAMITHRYTSSSEGYPSSEFCSEDSFPPPPANMLHYSPAQYSSPPPDAMYPTYHRPVSVVSSDEGVYKNIESLRKEIQEKLRTSKLEQKGQYRRENDHELKVASEDLRQDNQYRHYRKNDHAITTTTGGVLRQRKYANSASSEKHFPVDDAQDDDVFPDPPPEEMLHLIIHPHTPPLPPKR